MISIVVYNHSSHVSIIGEVPTQFYPFFVVVVVLFRAVYVNSSGPVWSITLLQNLCWFKRLLRLSGLISLFGISGTLGLCFWR